MRVQVKRRAAQDLREAKAWYKDRSLSLGKRFAVEFEEVLREIISAPAAFQVVEGSVRRALLLRFPFSVYYTVENENLIILAVLHFRRHPKSWKDAL